MSLRKASEAEARHTTPTTLLNSSQLFSASSLPARWLPWLDGDKPSASFVPVGATDGRKSPPGTIRGDFGISLSANLVHGSDSAESAAKELEIWFPNGAGLTDWERCDNNWLDAD